MTKILALLLRQAPILKQRVISCKMIDDDKGNGLLKRKYSAGYLPFIEEAVMQQFSQGLCYNARKSKSQWLQEACCGQGSCSGIINNRQRVSCVKFNSNRLGWLCD